MTRSSALLSAVLCATALFPTVDARASDRSWYVGAAYSDVSAHHLPNDIALPGGPGGPASLASVSVENPVDREAVLVLFGPQPIGSHGYKITAGYRVFDWLAFETDYLNLDANGNSFDIVCVVQPCPARISAETSSASVSMLALWPLGKFDLFARAGLVRWKDDVEGINTDGSRFMSRNDYGTDEKFGGGAQFHVHKLTARLEYERLRFGLASADTWSVGLVYEFR